MTVSVTESAIVKICTSFSHRYRSLTLVWASQPSSVITECACKSAQTKTRPSTNRQKSQRMPQARLAQSEKRQTSCLSTSRWNSTVSAITTNRSLRSLRMEPVTMRPSQRRHTSLRPPKSRKWPLWAQPCPCQRLPAQLRTSRCATITCLPSSRMSWSLSMHKCADATWASIKRITIRTPVAKMAESPTCKLSSRLRSTTSRRCMALSRWRQHFRIVYSSSTRHTSSREKYLPTTRKSGKLPGVTEEWSEQLYWQHRNATYRISLMRWDLTRMAAMSSHLAQESKNLERNSNQRYWYSTETRLTRCWYTQQN